MKIIFYLRIMLCFGFLIKIKHTYCVIYVTKRLTNGNSCFLEQVKAPGNEEECREPQPWNSDVFAALVSPFLTELIRQISVHCWIFSLIYGLIQKVSWLKFV